MLPYHAKEVTKHCSKILCHSANLLLRHTVLAGNVQMPSIVSQVLGFFFQDMLEGPTSHRHKGRWIR